VFLIVLILIFIVLIVLSVSASGPRCSIISVHVICLLIDFHIYTCVV